ncbi:MAG: 4Fe-4S dicluster domain-containing protein [Anaerolineales bacterium]|nr:4Fe-4S dicluster domain-containing protein [Anaerolineales bacterium]
MSQLALYGFRLVGLAWLIAFGYFGFVSLAEGEKRAARISAGLALAGGAIFLLASWLPAGARLVLFGVLILAGLAAAILFYAPVGQLPQEKDRPRSRFDERDVMFARWRLQPGTPEYEAYYAMRPENKASDDRTRARPGLYNPASRIANPYLFASPKSSFDLTEALREAVDGPISKQRHELPPEKLTAYLKRLAYYYGALQVGVTALEPYHVYSHIGRGSGVYGEPIPLDHRYALAFTVEMDFEMVGCAPRPQTLMESARQYVDAARLAVQLAGAIRWLGYSARAHIDGNYRLICPLVARDAGLGEIGRIGLLITPRQGPRVRLAVVTTDAKLIPDARKPDPAVIDFCRACKKCAENCPSQSIPFDERQEIDGALRWRIDSDACFHYWNVIGTDCGRCMAVCPFSHPDSLPHNIVRWGIGRSGAFRRAALRMDDLFYGKKPSQREAPGWTQVP